MDKRFSMLIILITLTFSISYSQDLLTLKTGSPKTLTENVVNKNSVFRFKVYLTNSEIEGIPEELAGTDLFGPVIAKKSYLLIKKYTLQETLSPGNPASKTIIRKPVIYQAVRKIERHLKKSVKNGDLPLNEAVNELNKVLDVALNILIADTKEFENAIEEAGDIKSKIILFTEGVILED